MPLQQCKNKILKLGRSGFSLLEIIFTIIIIGLAMGAITESFLVGSAKSVNIVNEETATNLAKQIMAELNYCRNGGTPTGGVCTKFNGGTWNSPSSSLDTTQEYPYPINNECYNTSINAQNVYFQDTGGSGTISGSSPSDFIQVIVKTGWFASNAGGGSCPAAPVGCPGTPGSCPYVTISTVYANY